MTKIKSALQLPPADEYQRAIQNPLACFADAELRTGQPHTNSWGLPLPWSGQFACVFRVKTGAGLRAVRCFTSQVTDQQDRYAALHDHLGASTPPMLADFEYQPQGMLVKGVWYPIVKMEWIEGETLDRVVEKKCAARDSNGLANLAQQWMNVVRGLQSEQIAHGDLQHDNILVNNGRIHLVDYDGIYVPGLRHLAGLEMGHPHYQHPARRLADYGPGIDRFPSLVIYLSLIALAGDPTLWERYHQDKHLILRNDDYRLRHESPLFLELSMSRDAEVRRLSLELLKACSGPASAAPALTTLTTQLAQPMGKWKDSWAGIEAIPSPATAGAVAAVAASAKRVGASVMRTSTGRLTRPTLPTIPLRPPDLAPLGQWIAKKGQALADWLTRCPAAPKLGGGLSLIVLLAAGVGGGILASYLSAIGANSFAQELLYAAVLPFAFVVTRRLGVALLAYLVMLNLPSLLSPQWHLSILWYALLSGAAMLVVLQRVRKKEFGFRIILDATVVGVFVRFVGSLVWMDQSPGWSELILSLVAATLAALLATAFGKGARTGIEAVK